MVARRQLPVRRTDLPARQPDADRATHHRSCQAQTARPLGHNTRPQLRVRPPEPSDPRPRSEHVVRGRARSRRARCRGQRLAGRHLHRDLPRRHPRRIGDAAAVPPVLLPGRHPQPRGTGNTRINQRRRRARLLTCPRLRNGGCAATARTNCSTTTDDLHRTLPRWHQSGSGE